MKLSRSLALTVLLLIGASARADFIPYSYQWATWTPGAVVGASDPTGHLALAFLYPFHTPQNGTGSQDQVPAMRVMVQGSATANFSNLIFSNSNIYYLYMHLQDGASQARGTLTFTGTLNGTIYNLSSTVSNPVQSITLGKDTYTVTINPFISPTATDPRSLLTANVVVTGPGMSPPRQQGPRAADRRADRPRAVHPRD
jgi:hypothetical protein